MSFAYCNASEAAVRQKSMHDILVEQAQQMASTLLQLSKGSRSGTQWATLGGEYPAV